MTKSRQNQRRLRTLPAYLLLGLVLVWFALSILPIAVLRWLAPPTTSFMLQYAQQQTAAQVSPLRYHWTEWDNIAPSMRLAAVAAEDQKFPHHHGFDLDSIEDALQDYLRGNSLRGASTISQQVAKNLFLWPDKTLWRKGLEAWFTLWIELCWSKQRILEVYLNIAEFGPGIYGVEAASLEFFHKTAAMLGPEEAALLAAALPNPGLYDVARPSTHMLKRQRWILRQMRQLGGYEYLESIQR